MSSGETAAALGYSMVSSVLGLSIGSMVSNFVPPVTPDEPPSFTAAVLAMQMAANAVAILVAKYMLKSQKDPTAGLFYFISVSQSQTEMSERTERLAGQLRTYVRTLMPKAPVSSETELAE